MSTWYWHDYETWGNNPSADRPSQFAGVRTDMDFNPVGEPLMLYCRPALDALIHPEACLVTGISPQQAEAEGVSEREFVARIHQELVQPNTCAVGYNSVRFDDEITRFSLYRNFFDPYAREWQNGNSRWDLIDVVRLCYAVRPEGIEWPVADNGRISFRLELLSEANGLQHEAAHDALSDVYATIGLARLIKTRQPKLFAHMFALRQKQAVLDTLAIGSGKPVLHVSARFSADIACASIVLPVCKHPVNSNEILCVDLRYSPQALLDLSAEELAEYLYTKSSELPQGIGRIPLKSIHINRCPVVLTTKLIDDAVAERMQISLSDVAAHRQQLLAEPGLNDKLQAVYKASQTAFPPRDAEESLYSGFIGRRDRQLCEQIVAANGDQLAKQNFAFDDARLPELLLRYRARNFPESLSQAEREEWLAYCADKWLGGETSAHSDILARIEILSASASDSQRALLRQLSDYLSHISERVSGADAMA